MSSYSKTLTVTAAKASFLELVAGIESTQETIAITRKGIPTMVMMSIEDYEGLLETLEIMGDPAIMKSLKKSARQIKQGKLLDTDEVWD